ncbi:hypothetical protein HGRIS_001763 [Hohenbuehelia grisea]|uniref:TEA domain-containing protein n=1 Tax=Hohenbuehelia grisea TaxID=104357 RepID=A0ABR3JK52_9AGAR
MAFNQQQGVDVFTNVSTSAPDSPERIRTSIHGDIICPPLRSGATRDVFQSIVKGRKSWKTLRGNGEAVWPPELEAALLEGLESYQPDDSRETRLLGRFPMRNRFISDYIFRVTGKRRTAKQVGSRLQQLRDTCGGKRLLSLLSPCRRDTAPGQVSSAALMREQQRMERPSVGPDASSGSDTSSVYSPSTPLDTDPNTPYFEMPKPQRSVICIDILPEDLAYPPPPSPSESSSSSSSFSTPPSPSSSPKRDSTDSTPVATPSATDLSYASYGDNVFRPSSQPRPLKSIDPTVTFLSRTTITAESFFTVFFDNAPVFQETTSLVLLSLPEQPESDGSLFYSTSLVPGFWKTICDHEDPTRYTIQQEVVQNPNTMNQTTMFSAVYKFNYPAGYSTRQSSSSPTMSNVLPVTPLSPVSPMTPGVATSQSEQFSELPLDYFMHMDPSAFTSEYTPKQENFYELVNPANAGFDFEGAAWGVPQPSDNVSQLCPPSFAPDFTAYVL